LPILFGGFSLILLALWIYCIFDVVTTDARDCRNLPKPLWFLTVLVLPDLGSIVWLILGRPRVVVRQPRTVPVVPPDDDEEFLRKLRERVEEQRRRAREQQERSERSDRSERPERSDRPEHPDRPDRPDEDKRADEQE
jgi:hypothetical protein